MAVRFLALRASRDLTPRMIPSTHFFYRLSQPQAIVRLEGLRHLKKFNNSIKNQTLGFPAFLISAQLINQLRYRVSIYTTKVLIPKYSTIPCYFLLLSYKHSS
jgi:hypothetical protein